MVVQTRSSCPKPVTVLDLPPNVLQCIASKLDTKEWAMALCTCRSFAEVQLEVFKLTDGPDLAWAMNRWSMARRLEIHYTSRLLIPPPDEFERLTASLQLPSGLQTLILSGMRTLTQHPAISHLTDLHSLTLKELTRLTALEDGIGRLAGLTSLDLECSFELAALPDSISMLTNLRRLTLKSCAKLVTLPEGIGEATGLTCLDLEHCCRLKALPQSISKLVEIRRLDLYGCRTLHELPAGFEDLSLLEFLEMRYCDGLTELPPAMGRLTSLVDLKLNPP